MSATLAILPPSHVNLLRLVQFATLEAWAYDAIFSPLKSRPKFPTIALGEVIAQRKGFIRIDDAQTYKRCRVQWRGQGVEMRDEIIGTKIKTKSQQVCRAGDFLVAEIDAKMGGFGIVPAELEGAVVSSHYFLFEVDDSRLNRDYLALYLRTEYFQQQVQSTGSTNYSAIRPHHVLGYRLPLPSLAEQERIVAKHRVAMAEAEAAEARAREYEQQAASFLETSLGLKAQSAKTKLTAAKLYFARFASLERWALSDESKQTKANYPLVTLGSLLVLVQYGLSEKARKEPTSVPLLRMNNVCDGELDFTNLKFLTGKPSNYADCLLRKGDILFNRTNSKELVGKTAVFLAEGDFVFASYLIRLRLNPSLAEPRFINYVFNSPFCRSQIDTISRQALGQANMNSKELRALMFPLPPLPEQERIVTQLDHLRAQARTARATAAASREAAATAFHAALFAQD